MVLQFGRQLRLRRLCGGGGKTASGKTFVVPLDHSVTTGPIAGPRGLGPLVDALARNDVDAIVLHKGSLRFVDDRSFADTSLVVHLSASTALAPDPDEKCLVGTVEECVRLGADAVSVHVNLGSATESAQLADFAAVAGECDRWNVPLLAMVYPRGPHITDPADPELVAHAVTLAADLGADVAKTVATASIGDMRDIVRACPIPILVAGGAKRTDPAAVLSCVDDILASGAQGVAMGRNVFQAADPGAMARRVGARVHAVPAPLAMAGR